MYFCNKCGSKLFGEDDFFCSSCGARVNNKEVVQEDPIEQIDQTEKNDYTEQISQTEETSQEQPVQMENVVEHQEVIQTKMNQIDNSDSTHSQEKEQYGAAVPNGPKYPDTSAQKTFSIVMIVIGALLLCCTGPLALIFAILGLVFVSQSEKATDVETANNRLKVALIMNCVSVGAIFLGLILSLLIDVFYSFFSVFSSFS